MEGPIIEPASNDQFLVLTLSYMNTSMAQECYPYRCQSLQNFIPICINGSRMSSLFFKTSPPSARVAAMSDMQQKTFKNKTTLKHHHKSFRLLLNTLTFSWNVLKNSRGVYSFLDSYILPCSLSKPQPNLNTRLGLTIKLLCTPHPTPPHHLEA